VTRDGTWNTFLRKANYSCPSTTGDWVCQSGIKTCTYYQVLGYYESRRDPSKKYTLVGCKIISGQTHQIRVHLQEFCRRECGIPNAGIVADGKYLPEAQSNVDVNLDGFLTHYLHSFKLGVPRIADSKK